jgi:putative hydrolase of the HAD superfamily
MPCLVLDATRVIFEAADDVGDLLIPFIAEKSTTCNEAAIQAAYLEVSLGTISPDEFWNQVGVAANLEDEFLSRHRLNSGVVELLEWCRDNDIPVWCLSNDVGRWSQKLRAHLDIETYLQGSIISGDVGLRKPDRQIYQALIDAVGYPVEELLFVDDREANALAARQLGIESILHDPRAGFTEARRWLLHRSEADSKE